MIRSFRDAKTNAVFEGKCPKDFPADLFTAARRKLGYLDAAISLASLNAPPGNALHALTGDRDGQHAIKVNDQFRICFRWTETGPDEVEFVDHH
jgi:toxin HigB-1